MSAASAASSNYQTIQPQYYIRGNVPLQNANIIWILENHKEQWRKPNGQLIDCILREAKLALAPLILAEGISRGQKIKSGDCNQLSFVSNQNLTVRGWDQPGA